MPRTPSPDDPRDATGADGARGGLGSTGPDVAPPEQAEALSAAERADALARLLSDAETTENELNGRSPDAARDFDAIMQNLARFIDGDEPAATIDPEAAGPEGGSPV